MTKTGWMGEAPDERPAMPITEMLLARSENRAGVLETALARSRASDAREAREEAAERRDPDEVASALIARGYQPGMLNQLAQQLGDTISELEAEREKIEKGERVQARAAREHAAGRIDAFRMSRMLDGDFGDAHRAEQLERRVESLKRQCAEAQQMISPQRQREGDPVAAAASRAQAALAEVTRSWAAVAQERSAPRERPPFDSGSRGRSTEHTGPDCAICAAARKRDAARARADFAAVYPEVTR